MLLAGLLSARPGDAVGADPAREAERQAQVLAVAAAADVALARLQTRLETAIDAARSGAALIVSGDDPPGPALLEAAGLLEGSRAMVDAGVEAVDRLRGTLAAAGRDGAVAVDERLVPRGLETIATQLRAAAGAAEPFVDRRRASEATLASLSDALEALDANDPNDALEALGAADVSLAVVADWEEPPPSLGYWLETTGQLLAAARAIADATIAEDPTAAAAAADAYRAAADRARDADRALALALAEAGSAIAVVPLRRLAEALGRLIDLRATVRSVLDEPR